MEKRMNIITVNPDNCAVKWLELGSMGVVHEDEHAGLFSMNTWPKE